MATEIIINAVTLTIVGHGKSDGDRIHINDFDIYVQDVVQHVELLKAKHPGLPLFIVGESMVKKYYNVYIIHVLYMHTCRVGLLLH